MQFIDIHTHNAASDAYISIYNAFVTPTSAAINYSVGIHPKYIADAATELALLESLLVSDNHIAAIGECGLDKATTTNWQVQEEVFKAQIDLANKYQKPLIIHCVRAYEECTWLLKNAMTPVIFHGFNKHPYLVQQLLSKGFYLSIGADILKHENKYKALLNSANYWDKIFFETDDSNVSIAAIYEKAACITSVPLDTIVAYIINNYNHIFVKK